MYIQCIHASGLSQSVMATLTFADSKHDCLWVCFKLLGVASDSAGGAKRLKSQVKCVFKYTRPAVGRSWTAFRYKQLATDRYRVGGWKSCHVSFSHDGDRSRRNKTGCIEECNCSFYGAQRRPKMSWIDTIESWTGLLRDRYFMLDDAI